jgi:HEAT repeat protein
LIVPAATFVCLLVGPAAARADRLPPDPVAALTDALKARDPLTADENEKKRAMDQRRADLRKKAAAIKNLGDMASALLLQDWRLGAVDEDVRAVDEEVWDELARRFQKGVASTLKRGNGTQQRAVATMIRELAEQRQSKGPHVQRLISGFAGDLAGVVTNNRAESAARQQAAAALARIVPDAAVAGKALGSMLKNGNTAERRVAARALGDWMRTLSDRYTQGTGGGGAGLGGGDRMRVKLQARDRRAADLPEVMVEAAEAITPAATGGLDDSDAEVRRLCSVAIEQVSSATADLIVVPRGLDFPAPGRTPSEADRRRMEDYRDDVLREQRRFTKLARLLRDACSARKGQSGKRLADLVNDRSAAVRLASRRALEATGTLRNRLVDRARSVPPIPKAKDEKKGDAVKRQSPRKTGLVGWQEPEKQPEPVPPPEKGRSPQDELLEGLLGARSALAEGLTDPNKWSRLEAVQALESLGEYAEPVADAVVRALCDPYPFVRWVSARILTGISPDALKSTTAEAVVEGLIPLLRDVDLDVELAAAYALGQYGPVAKKAVPELAKAVTGADADMRIASLQALQEIGTASVSAMPAMIKAVSDENARVREKAAQVLGRFGTRAKDAIPALRKALNDEDEAVRRAAGDALLAIDPARD